MTAKVDLLAAGRLSQRCPACGLVEAAGTYCTACATTTGAPAWFAQATGRRAGGSQRPDSAATGIDTHPAPDAVPARLWADL